MNNKTIRGPLEINQDKAFALGSEFCAARKSHNLLIQEAADQLLLSRQQILGLETANIKSFYSPKLFAQAADKYAALLGLEDKPSVELFRHPEAESTEPIAGQHTPDAPVATLQNTVMPQGRSSRHKSILASLVVNGAVGGGAVLYQSEPHHTDAAPQTVAHHTPKAEAKADITPSPVANAPVDQITLSFNDTSWVQTIDRNGNRVEKTYRKGDTVTLDPAALQSLIIGNARSVNANINDHDISLSSYIANASQVVRLSGAQIRKLAE